MKEYVLWPTHLGQSFVSTEKKQNPDFLGLSLKFLIEEAAVILTSDFWSHNFNFLMYCLL